MGPQPNDLIAIFFATNPCIGPPIFLWFPVRTSHRSGPLAPPHTTEVANCGGFMRWHKAHIY
jgi:hypothetical protein